MSETAEFLVVVPGWDPDKLDLCMEVCLYIGSRGDRATLVIPSYLSSAIPPSFPSNPLVAVAQIGSSSASRMLLILWYKFRWHLAGYLEERRIAAGGELPRKLYAVPVPGTELIRSLFRYFNVTVDPLPLAGLEIVRRWKLPDDLPEKMAIVGSYLSETAEFLVVVPGWDPDKLHLCMEVCFYIAKRGDHATLVIPSYLSSAIPPWFGTNALVAVAQIGSSSARRMFSILWFKFRWDLAGYLEERIMAAGGELPRKLYAVVIPGEESIRDLFRKYNVTVDPLPLAGLEIVRRWKLLDDLPEKMAIVGSDLSETAEFLVVVPGWDPDKLHLCMEVCLYIGSRGDRATLVIPSYLSSAIPPSFPSNPLVAVAQIGSSSAHRMFLILWFKFRWDLAVYLEERRMAAGGELPRKLYAVLVPGAESIRDLSRNFNVTEDPLPLPGLEIERMWKVPACDVLPGESRLPAGLPEEMAIVRSDLKMKPFGPPRGGPPGPDPRPGGGGGGPPSVPEVGGSIGRMTNKSADPEQPFFDNMGDRMKMVGGIRPLLPEQYWKTSGSVICGSEMLSRPSTGGFLSHRRWNSTSPRRSPFATWPLLGKRYYNTDSPGDHLKVGHVASNDMPKNVTVASEAFASFQFDLKLQRRIGRLQIGASISRLARSMR